MRRRGGGKVQKKEERGKGSEERGGIRGEKIIESRIESG